MAATFQNGKKDFQVDEVNCEWCFLHDENQMSATDDMWFEELSGRTGIDITENKNRNEEKENRVWGDEKLLRKSKP